MADNQVNQVRIVDIARLAGVSAGTVDRVIHKRGRVDPEKLEKIEKIIKEINYEPNLVARFLASRKLYTLAVVVPTFSKGDYWELVCSGIDNAAAELRKFRVEIKYFQFNQYDRKSFSDVAQLLKLEKCDGVLLATLFGKEVMEFSIYLKNRQIPFIYIDSAIEGQDDLAYFGGDSYQDGLIAAKLLLKEIGTKTDIFFAHIHFKYDEISVQMRTREQGFMAGLEQQNFQGTVYHLEINPDDFAEDLLVLEKIIDKNRGKVGGIVLNSRIYELLKVLESLSKPHRRKVVLLGHEAIERNVQALLSGKITYLLSQRPELQGSDALKALGNYILFHQRPEKVNFMPIDILIKENVIYYSNYKL
ncbi:transcriptional regulator [Bacteroidia bacterium]|nr:transcriptional regulator [Bacteroidia bacterium]